MPGEGRFFCLFEDLEREIQEIRRKLDEKEDTKEVRKAFWRLVGRVKRREFQMNGEIIEKITEIREMLFKKRVILSTKKGAILFPLVFLISVTFFSWINICSSGVMLSSFSIIPLLFLSEFLVLYFGFLTGRLLGGVLSSIEFDGFYRYSPLEFGAKVNYKSYLKASAWKRVVLYGTTILFQGTVMLILVLIVYEYNRDAVLLPIAFLFFWIFGSFIIHLKGRTGELHRFLRELKIALELRKERKEI